MSPKLPRQLAWRDFLRVLRTLGYELHRTGSGASRTFIHATRSPKFVTFHEPHDPATLATGTLRSYIRKLELSLEEFLDLLDRS